MIALTGVTKRYGDVVAALDVTLEVAEGELLALVGGSGSGKTTTLETINRLVVPDEGRVVVDGLDTAEVPGPELRRRIGYVFQGLGLFPHLTVAENIAVTPRLLGWERPRLVKRVAELLELVDLEPELATRMPDTLSGGQQQRVAFARAVAAEPRVLLCDEPFAAVDPPTRELLQQRLLRLREALGLTVVFVTHDMVEAMILADRIGVMRDGRLVQVGTPAALAREPADDGVAALVQTPARQTAALRRVLEGGADG